MGLTYGVAKHPDGTLAKNVTINFWCGGVKTSDVTDASGNYSLFLAGPAQYAAQVGGQPCAESPVSVPAGTLLCNLTTPTKDEPVECACACACACGCAADDEADHVKFFYHATTGKVPNGKPVQGNLPTGWGYEYQMAPGSVWKHECKGRKDHTDVDEEDVSDAVLVLQGPLDAAGNAPDPLLTADTYVKPWMKRFDLVAKA